MRELPRTAPGAVTLYAAGLCAVAAGLTAAASTLPATAAPLRLPWYLVAPLFLATESYVVNITFRREAHSLSLSEVPLVLGLFLCSPVGLLAGELIGAAVALGLRRRQSPLKMMFNLANFLAGSALAVLLLRAVLPRGGPPTLYVSVLTLGVVMSMALLEAALICGAIVLSERRLDLTRVGQTLSFAAVGSSANVCLGLIALNLLWWNRSAIWLLVVPAVVMYLAYRAYAEEREKRSQVRFLFDSTRDLQAARSLEEALPGILDRAREMFRANASELILLPRSPGSPLMNVRSSENGSSAEPQPVTPAQLEFIAFAAETGAPALIDGDAPAEAAAYLDARGWRNAMVSALSGDDHLLGVLVMADRAGDVARFDDEDLRLFGLLSTHLAVTLDNGRLGSSLDELAKLQEELRHQALHDPLTGLANRTLFAHRVERALATAQQHMCVMFIDLDDFKTINDSLGHAAGDRLLVSVASRVRHCLRAGTTVARLGGDEFAVLLESSSSEDGERAAHRILEALAQPFQLGSNEVTVRASIGIAVPGGEHDAVEAILRKADEAMYMAKARGKGGFVHFAPAMHAAVSERHELKTDLLYALERDELRLVYQPVVDVGSHQVTAVEALLRWHHPTRGVVMPAQFIPLAEETGMMDKIGRWVIQTACAEQSRWAAWMGSEAPSVAVNVASRQLRDRSLPKFVAEVLAVSGVRPDRLICEITEDALIEDVAVTRERLDGLKHSGVLIAIDDFGTGYSSLSRLRDFPVDILKIDRCFTEALDGDGRAHDLAVAVFDFAVNLPTVAVIGEGVERPEQMGALASIGCHWAQGYLLAMPMPADELDLWLAATVPAARAQAATEPLALAFASGC